MNHPSKLIHIGLAKSMSSTLQVLWSHSNNYVAIDPKLSPQSKIDAPKNRHSRLPDVHKAIPESMPFIELLIAGTLMLGVTIVGKTQINLETPIMNSIESRVSATCPERFR